MTTDAEHLIRVRELCVAAELQATGYGKGLNDGVNVTVRPDARTPQWIEARQPSPWIPSRLHRLCDQQ